MAHTQNPFDVKTYTFTLSWLTRASIRALAPFVGNTEYPKSFILDNQLEFNPSTPNIWVKPTEGKYAPLRWAEEGEKIFNYKGKKNAFFMAIKKWRPTLELAALGFETGYRLEFVLDKENGNRYVHTLLHLTPDGMQAGALPTKPKKEMPVKKQFNTKAKPFIKYEKKTTQDSKGDAVKTDDDITID